MSTFFMLISPFFFSALQQIISFERVNRYRGRHLEDPIKEIAALNLIGTSSPHVIGSIEIIQDDNFLYSIMPYCNGGDLYSHVMDEVASSDLGRISEDKARGYFIDILEGLSHMQKKGVVHRDLSLENILIHYDHCVIVDLGMSLRVPFADPDNSPPPERCVDLSRPRAREDAGRSWHRRLCPARTNLTAMPLICGQRG